MTKRISTVSAAALSTVTLMLHPVGVKAQATPYTFVTNGYADFNVIVNVTQPPPPYDPHMPPEANNSATTSQVIGQDLTVPGFSESVGTSGGTATSTLTVTGEGDAPYSAEGTGGVYDAPTVHEDTKTYAIGAPSTRTVGANVFVDSGASVGIEYYYPDTTALSATLFVTGDFGTDTTITVDDYFNPNPNNISPPPTSVSYGTVGAWAQGGNVGYTPPNGIGAVAVLTSTSSSVTVNLPTGGLTLGTLGIDSAASYTLAGSGGLTLQASTGPAQVIISQASHTISAPVTINSDTTFLVGSGAALTTPAITTAGNNIVVSGGGTLSPNYLNFSSGTITVNASTFSPNLLYTSGNTNLDIYGNSDGSGASVHTTAEWFGYDTTASPSVTTINQYGGSNSTGGYLMFAAGGAGTSGTYNLYSGNLSVGGSLEVGSNTGTTGNVNQFGGSVSASRLYLSYGGNGTYLLQNGTLTALLERIADTSGASGIFTQTGGTKSVTNSFYLGTGSTTAADYTISGGSLSVGGTLSIASDGVFEYDGGSVTGNVSNSGTFNVRGGGTETLTGNFTNNSGATLKTYGTTFAVTGTFTNNGTYSSDPATNHFGSLAVGPTGVLLGSVGDKFIITASLTSDSTNKGGWNTEQASLAFDGAGTHTFDINGVDAGTVWSGYESNFAWGILAVGHDQSLSLVNSSGTAEGGLYIGTLDLADGIPQLADISSDGVNVYYDAALNPWLSGRSFDLTGGGELSPIFGNGDPIGLSMAQAVPEPGMMSVTLLFLLTLVSFGCRRNSRASIV